MATLQQVRRNTAQQRFELEHDGLISVADYHEQPGMLVITHVGVPESQRGQGLALHLAAGVLQYARQEHLKIRPQCSFMAVYFQRHPQESDLLA